MSRRRRSAPIAIAMDDLAGGDAAYRYIVAAMQMALRGEVTALVTAPIDKEWLNRAGLPFSGHSELLAALSHVRLWRMIAAIEYASRAVLLRQEE